MRAASGLKAARTENSGINLLHHSIFPTHHFLAKNDSFGLWWSFGGGGLLELDQFLLRRSRLASAIMPRMAPRKWHSH
jgi:hypothetical protein